MMDCERSRDLVQRIMTISDRDRRTTSGKGDLSVSQGGIGWVPTSRVGRLRPTAMIAAVPIGNEQSIDD